MGCCNEALSSGEGGNWDRDAVAVADDCLLRDDSNKEGLELIFLSLSLSFFLSYVQGVIIL